MIVGVQPPARAYFSMAYDEVNHNIVLYGGKSKDGYLDDTWLWDGEVWVEANPTTPPPARGFHHLLYDPQRQKVVLYGGYDNDYLNDGWEWDGGEWQPVHFESFTPHATCNLMFYDQTLDRIVAQLSWRGTWYWKGNSWVKPALSVDPNSYCFPAAYDPQNQYAAIFVGFRNGQHVHETWIYKNMNWWSLDLTFEPTKRGGHTTFYDPVRKKVIIFGGFDGKNCLNDMWELVLFDTE